MADSRQRSFVSLFAGFVRTGTSTMVARLNPTELDDILALQLTVAWAGESAGDPPRLGWWKSDLVDREGGGDLFARLVPRTAGWASLGLAREAAVRVDRVARERLAKADRVWTMFHFGFAVDEQLQDRLEYHRNQEQDPKVLGSRLLVGQAWSKRSLESLLSSFGAVRASATPGGRKLQATAGTAVNLAPMLSAALLPLTPEYPMPYWEVPA